MTRKFSAGGLALEIEETPSRSTDTFRLLLGTMMRLQQLEAAPQGTLAWQVRADALLSNMPVLKHSSHHAQKSKRRYPTRQT